MKIFLALLTFSLLAAPTARAQVLEARMKVEGVF